MNEESGKNLTDSPLAIGQVFYHNRDNVKCTVTHEDTMCWYLCYFAGSSSKVYHVSKILEVWAFEDRFSTSLAGVSEYRIALYTRKIELEKKILQRNYNE